MRTEINGRVIEQCDACLAEDKELFEIKDENMSICCDCLLKRYIHTKKALEMRSELLEKTCKEAKSIVSYKKEGEVI